MPEQYNEEEWRAIPGYEGRYEVSSCGRVKSLPRTTSDNRKISGRLMRQAPREGYPSVCLYKDDGGSMALVHSLVLRAFVGPRPTGMQACHNDGSRNNNRLENLRWDSPAGNNADKARHGTSNRGSAHNMAKLSADDIHWMRRGDIHGLRQSDLAERFGVTAGHISDIARGRAWAHLPGEWVYPANTRRGTHNNNARLTPEKVREIRRLRSLGSPISSIAATFRVTPGTVGHVLAGRTWGHVE